MSVDANRFYEDAPSPVRTEAARRGADLPRVLVVDDNVQNVELLDALLSSSGYEVVKAYNGEGALAMLEESLPQVILLDVMMPGLDGYEVCRRLKENERTRLIPVVILTALNDIKERVRGIEAGADDFISKPFQKIELLARVKSLVRLKGLLDELEGTQNVIFSLAITMDFNDPYTRGHSQRVAEYGRRLAAHMGMPKLEQRNIWNGGILHDIGKIAVNKAVLHKRGALNEREYSHIMKHPVIGVKICEPLNFARSFLPIIRSHHEKFNGEGYPDGLAGSEIPLMARIICIADVYDALTTIRPYRNGINTGVALRTLESEAERGYWDPELVRAFSEMMRSDRPA
jgi:putative two-component system response regulator